MTMVGGGSDDSAAMLQFIIGLKERRKALEHEKAVTLLNQLKPGETLGSIPGAMKAWKTATGIEADPNRVISEETFAHLMDQHDVKTVLGMSPDLQTAMAQNRVLNAATGTAGPQTQQSYRTGLRTTETAARVQDTIAATAEQSLAKATPAVRQAIAERKAFGETGAQTVALQTEAQAQARTAEATAKVTEAQAKVVADFYADPDNSNFGQMLEKQGINATAAAQAFATGQGTLMTGILQLKGTAMEQAGQTLRTRIQVQGEIDKQLNQGRIDTAKEFNKLSGVPLETTLAIEHAMETGQNPFTLNVGTDKQPQQINPEYVHMYVKAKQLGYAGYIREQANKNNPQIELVKQMTENAKTFAKDPKLITAYNTFAMQNYAVVITEGELGIKRPDAPGELQDTWDRQMQLNYNNLAVPGKGAETFLGLDWLNKDDTKAAKAPAGMRTDRPVKAPGDTTAVNDSTPMFQDPDAAKAVRTMIGWSSDSTLTKR